MNPLEVRRRIQQLLAPEVKERYWRLVGYQPHAAQRLMHDSEARFKLMVMGRRTGKTESGPRELGPLIYIPDSYIWIVGPTAGLCLKEFRLFRSDIMRLARKGQVRIKKNVMDLVGGRYLLQIENGATIEVRSQEKEDQIVGEGLTGVIMAEAARLKSHIWRELVRPTLGDYHGVAVFSTTPRGRNWIYDAYNKANDAPDWAAWQLPSWRNPVLYPGGRNDPEIVAMEEEMDSSLFRQEIGAEFTTFSGVVYDGFDPDVHVRPIELVPEVPVSGWVDFGFVDPFVVLAVQVLPEGKVYVHAEYYVTHKTTAEHCERLEEYFGRLGGSRLMPERFYCDPRSPDGIKDMRRARFEAKAAPALHRFGGGGNPVRVGVNAVKALLKVQADGHPLLYIHPRCENLIREFGLYEWGPNDSPNEKMNNHACFPAGTMVATPMGDCPIEELAAGDEVYTHLGIGRVAVGPTLTGVRPLTVVGDEANTVSCTAEHPFLTGAGAWKSASLLAGERLWRRASSLQRKLLSTTGRSTPATLPRLTPRTITSGAQLCFASIAMNRRALAPVNVEPSSSVAVADTGATAAVYNLATSDGTFFANGFLVSNCDALRYGVISEVVRERPSLLPDDDEAEIENTEDVLGSDEDAPWDEDEPFALQRLRERERVRRLARR